MVCINVWEAGPINILPNTLTHRQLVHEHSERDIAKYYLQCKFTIYHSAKKADASPDVGLGFLLLILLKIVDCALRFMQKINFNYTHANYPNLPLIMPKGEKQVLPNFCLKFVSAQLSAHSGLIGLW